MLPVPPLVLGIETSCDDTACAVVDGGGRVVSSVVSSQLAAHAPYGGVVPEIASREHLANWLPVSGEALCRAGIALDQVDVVAATRGPGLVGALLVGLSLGKAIAYGLGRPFHAVHHLEGHLVSPFLRGPEPAEPPPVSTLGTAGGTAVSGARELSPVLHPPAEELPPRFFGLVLSGGHSNLFSVAGDRITTLAATRDDAFGEVFDKVGKRLGLPYPQGPRVDQLAELGDASAAGGPWRVAVPSGSDELDFSYSGLKSRALLEIERLERAAGELVDLGRSSASAAGSVPPASPALAALVANTESSRLEKAPPSGDLPRRVLDLLAAFRLAAVGQVLDRLDRLLDRRAREHSGGIELLAVSGGAAANRLLRRELAAWSGRRGVPLRLVPLAYSGDNAAMIAFAALVRHRRGLQDDPFSAEAESRIPI